MNILNQLSYQIINQPKLSYSSYDLGSFLLESGRRFDFQCPNQKKIKLKCSFYVPHSSNPNPQRQTPRSNRENKHSQHRNTNNKCVLYLHSMNGSRLQSIGFVESILKMGYCFCNFDFSGCGNSEGQGISFGSNQKYDVQAVINHLQCQFGIKNVILWGRSMGAVCAIKYQQMLVNNKWGLGLNDKNRAQIKGLILDSPFKSFSLLAVQLGQKVSKLPNFMVKGFYHIVKSNIEEMGCFKTEQLQLQKTVTNFSTPVLFLTSKTDNTISSRHSQELFDLYGIVNHQKELHKQLFYINGLHNETRDKQYLNHIKKFVLKNIATRTHRKHQRQIIVENLLNSIQDVQVQGNNIQKNCTCRLFGPKLEIERTVWQRKGDQQNLRSNMPTAISSPTSK